MRKLLHGFPRMLFLGLIALCISQVASGQALSGSYTIGGTSPDYATFSAAATALTTKGVGGPVTFNVRAGTYKERLVLTAVTGASATNTITFKGAGASSTTLSDSSTSTTPGIITLNGADYITIQDMTIEGRNASATGYGIGVLLTNKADYNTIKNCTIKLNAAATGGSWYGIASGTSTTSTGANDFGNYDVFDGNTISGGYYAIYLQGAGTTNYTEGTVISNNLIDNWYRYGIYTYYQDGLVVDGNHINLPRSTIGDAMYHYYTSNFSIVNNFVRGDDYGLYMANANLNFAGSTPSLIANNMLVSENYYGFSIGSTSKNINVYHNSIHSQSATLTTVNLSGVTNLDFRNNIVVKSGGGSNVAFTAASGVTFSALDFNLFYAPGSSAPYSFNGTTYTKLSAWQAAYPMYNQNSVETDPGFKSATDLHLAAHTVEKPYGYNVGINLDIDKDVRCVNLPTIGADESTIGRNAHMKVALSAPDTVFVKSPAEIAASVPVGQKQALKWYLDNIFIGTGASLDLVAPTTGTHQLKIAAENCGTRDSAVKDIVVINPPTKPTVQFLANKNLIDPGELVQFAELTSGGTTNLRWSVSPATVMIAGNSVASYTYMQGDTFSRNPLIRFNLGGAYKICLTATNGQGSTTLCKDDYIKVTAKLNLTVGKQVVRDTAGTLYDDGGPNANYTSTTGIRSILISPCAGDLKFTFKSFELECGYDYVRIFDGADNTGKPLHTCTSNSGSVNNGPGFSGTATSTCTSQCRPGPKDTFYSKTGSLYIEMVTDGSGTYAGFEGVWSSKTVNTPKPVADFTLPDSICTESLAAFVDKSEGGKLTYLWDLDGDPSTFEATTMNTSYGYFQPGLVDITLIVSNCGGSDTITKSLRVFNPATPVTNFVADNVNPTINDVVFFSTAMPMCVSTYEWRFKPAAGNGTAMFVNGTSKGSAAPQVTFTDTGCYTVFLYTKNTSGEDSLELSCFVRVKSPYCIPAVKTLIPDIGISMVKIHTLESISSQGAKAYENFTSTRSVTLETGVKYSLTVGRNTNVNEVTRTVWIDWNHDGDFTDAGERVGNQVNSIDKDWTISFTVPASTLPGATVMRVAINHGGRANDPCGPNAYGEFEDYRVYITPDLTPPVITMLGSDTVYVEQGRKYTDAGATAFDNLNGDITSKIVTTYLPTFDNMSPATYFVNYDVKDAAGNQAERKTRVVIVTNDVTAPNLIVSGSDTTYVAVGDLSYTDPVAVTAEDLVDGDLIGEVIKAGSADPNKVGTYTITFSVQDLMGNKAVVIRTVIVQDLIKPELHLTGDDTVYTEIGSPYVDAGATATDNYDADLDTKIVPTGNVDTDKLGTYTIVYNVTDASGNKALPISRTVIVRDTKAPTVTLNGDSAVKLQVNTGIAYVDPSVTVTDNSKDANLVVTGSYFATFPSGKPTRLGNYTIIYTATDASGNSTSVSRDIKVVDEIAPVITLKGRPGANVCRWDEYKDAGYDLSDNYFDTSKIDVTVDGDLVNTQVPGIYNFRYKAVDSAGNTSYSDWRIINVKEAGEAGCMTGINALGSLDKAVNVYPNPNNGRFSVSVSLGSTEKVSIRVLNSLGSVVINVAESNLSNGTFAVDLSNQASGVYMLQITAGDKVAVKRVIVNK